MAGAGVASFSFSADDQNCIKVIGAQRERARGRRALAVPESGTDKQNSRSENIKVTNLYASVQRCDLSDCIYIKMRFSGRDASSQNLVYCNAAAEAPWLSLGNLLPRQGSLEKSMQ